MEKSQDMTLKAIGTVRNSVKQPPGSGYAWKEIVSEVVIDIKPYLPGYDAPEEASVPPWTATTQ